MRSLLKAKVPEVWEINFVRKWNERGLPTPRMSIECQLPDFQDERTYNEEKFDWTYPENMKAITLEDLDMTIDDALHGI